MSHLFVVVSWLGICVEVAVDRISVQYDNFGPMLDDADSANRIKFVPSQNFT